MFDVKLFEKGRYCFNSGDFFQAHEIWEEIWQDLRKNYKDSKEFYQMQALIQLAVSLHLISKRRIVGAKKVLERASLNIQKANDPICGVNIDSLYQEIIRFLGKNDLDNCQNVKI